MRGLLQLTQKHNVFILNWEVIYLITKKTHTNQGPLVEDFHCGKAFQGIALRTSLL